MNSPTLIPAHRQFASRLYSPQPSVPKLISDPPAPDPVPLPDPSPDPLPDPVPHPHPQPDPEPQPTPIPCPIPEISGPAFLCLEMPD